MPGAVSSIATVRSLSGMFIVRGCILIGFAVFGANIHTIKDSTDDRIHH
jgi:hypothetical protein